MNDEFSPSLLLLLIFLSGSYNQCDFEGDLCSSIWSHLAAPEDDFDWTRVQALKMSQITFDHTTDTGNGYYMYMDPQNRAQSGDKTQLGSYIIQASNTNCKMRFFYYMTGINGGTLNVYTRTMVGGPLLLRWTDAVDRGLMWMKEVITLNSDDMFQVIIEGVKGQGSTGILAIDDTTFTPECRVSGSSLPVLTTGVPTTTVPTTSTKPSSKPSSPSQTNVITTTAEPTKQQGTHSPLKGGTNTGLVAGLSATAVIIVLIILVVSVLFWRRGRRGKGELRALRSGLETPGFDKDFGNVDFALQEVDTSMFGQYEAGPTSTVRGIDNPVYSAPAQLPIDGHTEA